MIFHEKRNDVIAILYPPINEISHNEIFLIKQYII